MHLLSRHLANNIEILSPFESWFQNLSYKPSVYGESENLHRPSGRPLQRIAFGPLIGKQVLEDMVVMRFGVHDCATSALIWLEYDILFSLHILGCADIGH